MTWAHPDAVGLVALLGLGLAGAVGLGRLRAARRLRQLLGRPVRPGRRSDVLLLLAAACVALAWLGPQLGTRTVRVPASGLDVVLLVDVSRSMDARDVAPSRLARARRTATRALAGLRAGDRAALAVFAGHGAVLAPLTPDKRALSEMVAALDTDLMSDAGSDGAAGLARALEAFEPQSLRPRVLLVLSDGESETLAAADAGDRAAEADVRVVSALFGREKGAPIPLRSSILRHANGEPVRTRREREAASALAARTGGRVLLADAFGEVPPEPLLAALRAGAVPTAEGTLAREVPVARFTWPALAALALLLAEARGRRPRGPAEAPGHRWTAAGAGARRGLRRRGAAAALAGAAVLALGAAPGDPAARRPTVDDARAVQRAARQGEAAEEARARRARREAEVRADPRDAGRLVRLGVARAREGDLAGAQRTLEAAALRAREPGLVATAYYDLGVAALARGELAAARDAFFDALAFAPSDAEARRHLEWALRALEREEPPPGGSPPRPEPGGAEPSPDADPSSPRPDEGRDGASAPDEPSETPAPQEAEAGDARAEPREPSRSGAEGRARDPAPPPLDAAEAERWMRAVQDDPGRALRAAAEAQGAGGRRPSSRGPRW